MNKEQRPALLTLEILTPLKDSSYVTGNSAHHYETQTLDAVSGGG
jgi:hypothetical protein